MNQLLQKPITSREVILAGVGSASGAGAAVTLWTLLNKLSAEQVFALSKELGGYFFVTLAFLFLGVRFGGQLIQRLDGFVGVQREFVAEQAKLAGAVQSIASRDDARAREQEAVLDHLSRSHDELIQLLKDHLAAHPSAGEAR